MSELPLVDPSAPPSLAEQALANLVNQFARPLDFLRELAQNSIDAGSPRIDVSVDFSPSDQPDVDGVLRIQVDDFGEGMDEDIIDNQLTRLFSSTKEDDLTKIGKFGIGFTSIFAIQPEAVLLRTGRHGEFWELLFHADRSFDKVRIEEPVQGTQITLFKRHSADRLVPFVQELRFVLDYWCEHSDTPITFVDLTQDSEVDPNESADPFDAFSAARGSKEQVKVNRPLSLEADLQHLHTEEGIEVAIGYADPPRFGFYNGGLTLLNTQNTDVLGEFREALGHLSFKVKHDGLEHTLTRDNVLHDVNWEHAMQAVLRARTGLREKLVEGTVKAVAEGEPLGTWHARLAAASRAPGSRSFVENLSDKPVFRGLGDRPITLEQLRRQEGENNFVMMADGPSPLHDVLLQENQLLLEDHPATRELVLATEEPPVFVYFQGKRNIRRADEIYVLPALVDPASLDPMERRLLELTEELLRSAVGVRLKVPMSDRVLTWAPSKSSVVNRLSIRVGDFGGMDLGRTDVLALNGPTNGRVFQRPKPQRFYLPAFMTWRTLLVNRHHPLFRAQLLASASDLQLAAFGLASALLHCEGIEGDSAHHRMLGRLLDDTEDSA
ncbi:MAG: ATP-binding protein [Myxococcales bacterium]|nr:ATP-binding protein [Myxococcales bacterium]